MAMPAWVSELNVAATVLGVFASTTVACLAIWGDRIRAAVLKPRLLLELRNAHGELTKQTIIDTRTGTVLRVEDARYFHIRVTNGRAFPAAHEVGVYLTKVEIPGPSGDAQTFYENDLPLPWMHGELNPNRFRTVGYTTVAFADLLFVRSDQLEVPVAILPANFQNAFRPDAHFWITVVARGIDGQSNYLRLKVDWDGGWNVGQTEFGRHFHIVAA